MPEYVENIVGFSRQAFYEAYTQGVASGDESSEMDLTSRTYNRVKELESRGNTIEMVMVGFEKTIILYSGGKYEIIPISRMSIDC